jgi:hypothetical protein
MARQFNYDKHPYISCGSADECVLGCQSIAPQLETTKVVCVECYPGVLVEKVEWELTQRLPSAKVFSALGTLHNFYAIDALQNSGPARSASHLEGQALSKALCPTMSTRERNPERAAWHLL